MDMDIDPAIYMTDDKAAIRFYYEPAKNNFASDKCGRPVYDKVLFAELMVPGSKESSPILELERTFCEESGIEKPRRSSRYDEFVQQIDRFKSQDKSGDMQGTPLKQWPLCDVAMAATLNAAKIYTVEGLANITDSALGQLGMGARLLREQAVAFLESTKGGDTSRLVAENQGLKDQIGALTDRLAALEASHAGEGTAKAAKAPAQALPATEAAPAPVIAPATAPANSLPTI